MAKDPAFLFYPGDWLGGTMGMTCEQKGAYLDLLIFQFNNGKFTEAQAKQVLSICFSNVWQVLSNKFKSDGKFFWNERLNIEIEKRKSFSNSRRINALGGKFKHKSKSKAYAEHMENENANENRNKDVNGNRNLPQPTLNECEAFFQQCGKTREEGEKFYRHYQAQDWKRGNGLKVTDWASLAQKWILNPKIKSDGGKTKLRNQDGSVNWSEVDKSADEYLRKQGLG